MRKHMQRSTLKDLDPIMTADLMAGSCASIFTDQDDRVSRLLSVTLAKYKIDDARAVLRSPGGLPLVVRYAAPVFCA